MASTKSIGDAIKLIPGKKADLRKSLEELRAISSSLSSFLLKWDDLDSHLTSVQSSIDLRFKKLQSLEGANATANANTTTATNKKPASPSPSPSDPNASPAASAAPRPELLSICSTMDGPGLRKFVGENRNDLNALRPELISAIRSAPDPARLVLEAVRGFYSVDTQSTVTKTMQHFTRRTCILLLEQLCTVRPEIGAEVAADAKKLAVEWKGKMVVNSGPGDHSLPAWGFLELVAAFRLTSEFDIDNIFDAIMMISRRRLVVEVAKTLEIAEHIPKLIEKLISNGKQLDAARFAHAFELTEKYPLVPLLKDYVKESKKVAQEVRKKGNNSTQSRNEATAKEISFLNSVIKAIDEFKLESEYPAEPLQKQVERLEKMKAEKKRNTIASAPNAQFQTENANKRARAFDSSLAATVAYPPGSMLSNQSQPFMADRSPFLGSGGPYSYGVAGLSHFDRAGAGLREPSLGRGSNFSPPKSYIFPSASGLYERSVSYDRPPIPYDRPPAYDRPSVYERPGGFGNYTLSGGLP